MSNRQALAILGCALLSGCGLVMSSVTRDLADGLSHAVVNNEDLAGVRDGAPAFLLLLDGLLVKNPDNPELLFTAADLNGAYATAFVADAERQALLADKALSLAERGACRRIEAACGARTQDYDELTEWVDALTTRDLRLAYSLAGAWAGWIQVHTDDWNAIAELARVRRLVERIVEIDETYADGGAHLYLGVLDTLFPPAMGGHPDAGREHFERAIELSSGRNLLAKVLYARQYARLVFDRTLHDRLLGEVMAADPRAKGFTLTNLVAREQARELLDSADRFF